MSSKINLPEVSKPRVVILGGGFAGVSLVQSLSEKEFQVVLIDKNNYHQFQPLFYQVAMAGLEPSSIIFPLRKILQKTKKFYRMAEVIEINTKEKQVITNKGIVNYDYLVIATGCKTNYFGNEEIKKHTLPMKSVSDSIKLRNIILENLEDYITCTDDKKKEAYLNIAIVGGGPTGVELAGSLAEMRKLIIPKDYREINPLKMKIFLIESNQRLLKSMTEKSSEFALEQLKKLGVLVHTNTRVEKYDGAEILTNTNIKINTYKVIWAAGVKGNPPNGLPANTISNTHRILVNELLQVINQPNVFALGDIAQIESENNPNGHPQVAQVAIQQAKCLAINLNNLTKNKPFKKFSYKDLGSMATIGRNKAVAEIGPTTITGRIAWYLWLIVHLKSILGVKNKIFILVNWVWNYLFYDQSLRLIIKKK
jgi:NADH dehydrogenase